MRSFSLEFAYAHIRAGLGRVSLSIVAIALGVALVVAVHLMNGAVLASFIDGVDALAGRAALTVFAAGGVTIDEDLVPAIAKTEGVKLAVPLIRSVAFPDDRQWRAPDRIRDRPRQRGSRSCLPRG
jgi:hypothetical protein